MRRRWELLGPLSILSAACVLWSCADLTRPAPAERTATPTLSRGAHGGSPVAAAALAACGTRREISSEARIGPTGGVLRVGRSYLVVPPGALPAPVQLSAKAVQGSSALVHFEPHGLHFNRPAMLVLDVGGCNIPASSRAGVGYVDDDGTILEWIDATLDHVGSTLVAPILHFSGYAVAVE